MSVLVGPLWCVLTFSRVSVFVLAGPPSRAFLIDVHVGGPDVGGPALAGPIYFCCFWIGFLIGGPAPAGLIDSLSLDVHVSGSTLVGLNLFFRASVFVLVGPPWRAFNSSIYIYIYIYMVGLQL